MSVKGDCVHQKREGKKKRKCPRVATRFAAGFQVATRETRSMKGYGDGWLDASTTLCLGRVSLSGRQRPTVPGKGRSHNPGPTHRPAFNRESRVGAKPQPVRPSWDVCLPHKDPPSTASCLAVTCPAPATSFAATLSSYIQS